MNKKNILNVATAIITIAVQFGIGLILTPYIVKNLGESANGYTQLANNFVSYASLITLSFNSMAGRFMSVSYYQKRYDRMNAYYTSVIRNNIVIMAMLIPVSIIVITFLEHIIVIDDAGVVEIKLLFACVFINFFINMFISIFGNALFVTNNIFIRNVINCLIVVVRALLLFAAFVLLGAKIYLVTLTALIASGMGLIAIIVVKKRVLPNLHYNKKLFDFECIKELFLSGIWNTVNQCGTMLLTGFDLLLSNLFISPVAMGILSVAKTMPNAIDTLAASVSSSFTPTITSSWASGNKERLLKELRNDMKMSTIILTAPIIVFLAFSTEFYRVWIPTLDSRTLAILSFLSCMHYIPATGTTCVYNVLTASNKLKVSSLLFAASGVVNVIVVYTLLSFTNLGVYLIAGASSILHIIRNTFIILPYVSYILNIKWYSFFKEMLLSLTCALTNLIVSLLFKKTIQLSGWLGLMIPMGIACVLAFILDIMIVLTKSERTILLESIMDKIGVTKRSSYRGIQ